MNIKVKTSAITGYRRLLGFLWPYWKILLIAVICMIVVSGSNLIVPWIIKDIVERCSLRRISRCCTGSLRRSL